MVNAMKPRADHDTGCPAGMPAITSFLVEGPEAWIPGPSAPGIGALRPGTRWDQAVVELHLASSSRVRSGRPGSRVLASADQAFTFQR